MADGFTETTLAEPQVIPSFYLYGEPHRTVGDRFLHLEALDDRSRPSDWNIRPHSHLHLNHLFFIEQGGGEMQADAAVIAFHAPCLLLVPARLVHAFTYEAETRGSVLTIADPYLREILRRDPDLGRLFAAAAQVELDDATLIVGRLRDLAGELAWQAPGHDAAVEAILTSIFVIALRLHHAAHAGPATPPGSHAGLVAQFRGLVEENYRSTLGVPDYAALLAVTPKRLRGACLRVAGDAPLKMVLERRLLEAKRLMLYSNMTLTEIAYHLGFSDPAYFSRFFRSSVGMAPRLFRDCRPQV